MSRPSCLALLAEADAQQGQPEAGRAVLAEGLAMTGGCGEYWSAAEVHRLYGPLLMQAETPTAPSDRGALQASRGAPSCEAAEARLYRAWHMAQHQEATSLELRAALSLARLWQRQGTQAEASGVADPGLWLVHRGCDTADLQEAKALLDEPEDNAGAHPAAATEIAQICRETGKEYMGFEDQRPENVRLESNERLINTIFVVKTMA